jgi:predicted ribosome quality control (RQC) complex YloA/Tae2 family protein
VPDERTLVLRLPRIRGLRKTFELIVELRPSESNVALTEGDDRIIRHLLVPREVRGRRWRTGHPYPAREGKPRRGSTGRLPRGEWMSLLEHVQPVERRAVLLSNAAFTSALNAEWILGEAAEQAERAAVEDAYGRWLTLAEFEEEDVFSLPVEEGPQPYPHPLGHADAERIPSLMDALGESASDRTSDVAPSALGRRLDSLLGRARRRVGSLRRELESATDPQPLRETGDLLLARLAEIERGASGVTLEGFDGELREVELDPSLSPQDNAAAYYEHAGKAERARERIPGLIAAAEAEADRWRALRDRVEAGEISVEKLESLLPTQSSRRPLAGEKSLPYRSYRSSGGIEIRVGRGAKRNDELTFRHARPNDVWLHARHAAGAHVVLRWAADETPPAKDLEEAAVLAALHSKARTSGSTPVDWTRRKYVRKSKGARSGIVTLERVRTVFVEPDPALLERLEADEA